MDGVRIRPLALAALFLMVTGQMQHACAWGAEVWPELPESNAAVDIPAQEWPLQPGPRTVRVTVHYPGGHCEHVGGGTGIMLSLHNWGGTACRGTADPQVLADELDVVALCVDYLQSGDGPESTLPYDFGYLQALDALRALWFVYHGLQTKGIEFHRGRLYATGGSGGGNVSLMANKLAPRTFACIVDMCGMKRLSDDIAFGLPGGSSLNARYARDPGAANYLSPDHQELRFVGHPEHLRTMREMGATAHVVVVHGVDDATCPFADAEEMVANFEQAGLSIEPHFIGPDDLDGKVFTSSGHSLGDRTQIVLQVAGRYLRPGSAELRARQVPANFDVPNEVVRYETQAGAFVISYAEGYPVGRFEPAVSAHE